MATTYNITKTNGDAVVPGGLSPSTINTLNTSLTLIGQNYAGYGQFLNNNFVRLLENFAFGTAPANPLAGQLWWDTTNNILRVYSGTSWKISTGATSQGTAPGDLSALGGDLWFDTSVQQLKLWSGTSWITVGPPATPATGVTGAFPNLVTDSGGGQHVVIQFTISGVVYAMFSKDTTFTTLISGFNTIKPGLNFSTSAPATLGLNTQDTAATNNTLVQRTSTGGINATNFNGATVSATSISATSLTGSTFNGNLVGNVSATTISASAGVTAQAFSATSGYSGTILTASQPNITSLGNLAALNVAGVTNLYGTAYYKGFEIATTNQSISSVNGIPVGNITPSTGVFTTLQVNSALTPAPNVAVNLGNVTHWWNTIYGNVISALTVAPASNNSNIGSNTQRWNTIFANTVDVSTALVPGSNVSVNIGTPTLWFNNIYGRAIQAQYADLAERFESDAEYLPGTVVELGGTAEITQVVQELSEKVLGVISTNAAYLMNSAAGSNSTHPPVAMSGRVPVRAIGLVKKGDRLVSAGNGLARAGQMTEITPWNVIGRSLVDKHSPEENLIEAIVKINS